MRKQNGSHATSTGQAVFRHTGRYTEVTKDAKGVVKNDAANALDQKNLVPKKSKTAASSTLKSAAKELDW